MPKVTVDASKCTGAQQCIAVCPVGVFEIQDGKAVVVNEEACTACHACEGACPSEAIVVED